MSKKRNYKVTWAELFIVISIKVYADSSFFDALVVLFLLFSMEAIPVTLSLFLQKIASGLENTYLGVGFFFLDTNRLVYSR